MELAVPTSQSLDIVLLRTFLEVVDRRGFALAANNLALTPPQSGAYQAPGTDSRRQNAFAAGTPKHPSNSRSVSPPTCSASRPRGAPTVFGKQCRRVGDDGELLWEELVWAAATAIELPAGEPLRWRCEPCVYREAAITASAPLRVPGAWCSRVPAWPAACPPRWPVSP